MAESSINSSTETIESTSSIETEAIKKSNVSWTDELVEKLIELFSSYPCLYDVKHSDYHDRDKRSKAFAEIASDLDVSIKDVMKKIKNLRTQYKREKGKKKTRKSGQGADEVYVVKWQHFTWLDQFLDQFEQIKETTSTLVVDDNDYVEEDEQVQEDIVNIEESMRSTKRPLHSIKKEKLKATKKRKEERENELLEQAVNYLKQEGSEKKNEDEDDMFAKFVASELREIKDQHFKRQAKWRIQCVLYESHSSLCGGQTTMPMSWPNGPICPQQFSSQYFTPSPGSSASQYNNPDM